MKTLKTRTWIVAPLVAVLAGTGAAFSSGCEEQEDPYPGLEPVERYDEAPPAEPPIEPTPLPEPEPAPLPVPDDDTDQPDDGAMQ